MKFPKSRATVYVVTRGEDAICGVFADWEEADDYRTACEQEWFDKTGRTVQFFVKASTFYG